MKTLFTWVSTLLILSVGQSGPVSSGSGTDPSATVSPLKRPSISGQVVFLYYSDIQKAAQFYESIMSFESTFSLDWVKIYRTVDGSSLGLVDEKRGFLRSAQDKPVMVSWVTDDVGAWYEYLKGRGVKILSPPKDSAETGIRGFVFTDPEGYTLEIFQWTR